jgi:hypothetical protein
MRVGLAAAAAAHPTGFKVDATGRGSHCRPEIDPSRPRLRQRASGLVVDFQRLALISRPPRRASPRLFGRIRTLAHAG